MAEEDDLDRARFPDVAAAASGGGMERLGTFAGADMSGRAASFAGDNMAQRGRSLPRGNTATRSFSLTRNSNILTNADFLVEDQPDDALGERSMSKAERDILFTSHRSKLEALFSGGQSEMSEAPVLDDVPDAEPKKAALGSPAPGNAAKPPVATAKSPPSSRPPNAPETAPESASVTAPQLAAEKKSEKLDRSRTGQRGGGGGAPGFLAAKYNRESSGSGRKMPSLSSRLQHKGSSTASHASISSAPPLSPTSYRSDLSAKLPVSHEPAADANPAFTRQKTGNATNGSARNFSQKLQTIKARLTRGSSQKPAAG
mmetsp:Transcript_11103/g.29815  ORF Transcript_11103/g.29815 Transcript_11103/m.29815 type:complete len:315 (+) Transcript_11103:73-1017(+)